MRYLELTIDLPPEQRHPMHQFAVEHDDYRAYWLLHWQGRPEAGVTMLFYVAGPVEPYVEALEDHGLGASHAVTEAEAGGFYLYALADVEGADRGLVDAVLRPGVLVVPPVRYGMSGAMEATFVGPPAALDEVLDELPDAATTDVLGVGPYEERALRAAGDLTDRQREVVGTALELGYYEEPREATLEDVAAATGCTTGTVAEHVRKAEASVMERAVEQPVAPPVVSRAGEATHRSE